MIEHIDNFPTAYALGGNDYGTGVHLSGENGGYSDDALDQLVQLHFSWAKLLNFGIEPPNLVDTTYGKLLRKKIYPITRIYRDKWGEISTIRVSQHTEKAKTIISACGYDVRIVKPLVQIYNELNNGDEWQKAYNDNSPEEAAESIYFLCAACIAVGGIPVIVPSSPGGEWGAGKNFLWDLKMYKRIAQLADFHFPDGKKEFFKKVACGVHNYTDTKYLDWGRGSFYRWDLYDFRKPNWKYPSFTPGYEDNQGFCGYEWLHDLVYEIIGVEPNIVSCEGGFCANGGNFYRADLDKGYPASWKMPYPLHASYITSQMALQMGFTVIDPTCVRSPMSPTPKYYHTTAFWTFGTQPGWWNDCDIRNLPQTVERIKQMTVKARDASTTNSTDNTTTPVGVITKTLKVIEKPGHGVVQGNLPKGTMIVIGYFGNDDRHRVIAGSKPELGEGGFEQVVYQNPDLITIKASNMANNTVYKNIKIQIIDPAHSTSIPFITEGETIVDTPTSKYELVYDFATFAERNKIRQVVATSEMVYNSEQNAYQSVSLFYGGIRRDATLVWDNSQKITKCIIMDKNVNIVLL